jgi:hypothetical protein
MGARTKIALQNPLRPDLSPLEVEALVDSRRNHLSVPAAIALQLGLQVRDERWLEGRSLSYVGPVLASYRNRSCFAGAVVHGREVVLGSIPMDAMDLVVLPDGSEVAPNPLHPNIPGSIAVGHRAPAEHAAWSANP